MRAVVFDGEVRVKEVPMPERAPSQALIRVFTAGICNTDLEIVKGYMGFQGILGHEFVGVVQECTNSHLQGKRVVGEINCVCHTCQYCRLEMPHHCMNRTVLGIANHDGAFAEYLVIPEENLHLVPGSIRDDVAVFAEPLAAAFRIAEQLTIDGDDEIVVLGDGKLGLLCAQVMWLYSKRLICVGKHPWKLDLLKPLHIQTALNEEFAGIASADIVVEATGSPEGLSRALELVRPEGTIVLKTTSAAPVALPMSGAVVNEVKIIGSRCGPFRPALEALALGNVEVRPMVSEVYALADAVHALERAAADDVIKVLLHI